MRIPLDITECPAEAFGFDLNLTTESSQKKGRQASGPSSFFAKECYFSKTNALVEDG